MVGEINVIATLGPVGAGPSPQDSGDMALGADFSALLDEAAVVQPQMPNVPADTSARFKTIAAPVFIAEWCFAGSDAAVTVQGEKSKGGAPVDQADDVPVDDDDEIDEVAGDGVLNIDWLLAQPKRMLAVERDGDISGDATEAGKAVAPVQAETAPAQEPTPKATNIRLRTAVNEPAANAPALPKDAPKQAVVETPVLPEQFANAAETTKLEQPKTAAAAALPTVKAQPTASVADVPVLAKMAPATEQPTPSVVAATPRSEAPVVERASGESLRSNAVSTRLSKAIERLGGGNFDAALINALPSAQGDATSNNASFSSNHESSAANLGAARTAPASAPAFTVHVTPELSKAVEMASRAVDAPLPSNPQLPSSDTVHQLVQTMRMQFRDGIGDAIVRLRPEHLGEVSISLRVDQQSVSATVHAEQATVRQWLESQESSLRNGLAEQGLHLEKFVVRKDPEQEQQQQADHEEAQRRNRQARRQRQGQAEPRFEITV
jgi:flagellar hook-length control protein FliK